MATKAKKAKGAEPSAIDRFYAGQPLECPIGCGGAVEVVRVGTGDDGAGEIWYECTACAQRASVKAPAATAREKKEVDSALQSGDEPRCPRHAHRTTLRRRGRHHELASK